MKKTLTYFYFVFFILTISNTTLTSQENIEENIFNLSKNKLYFWFNSLNNDSISNNNFIFESKVELNLIRKGFIIKELENNIFSKYYIYNTDNENILDIYSYSQNIENVDNKLIYSGSNVDTEIYFFDMKNKELSVLDYYGSDYLIEDACFYDSNIIIVGCELIDDKYVPLLVFYDLKQKSKYFYRINHKIIDLERNYFLNKFENDFTIEN